jgi:hypothetical protein
MLIGPNQLDDRLLKGRNCKMQQQLMLGHLHQPSTNWTESSAKALKGSNACEEFPVNQIYTPIDAVNNLLPKLALPIIFFQQLQFVAQTLLVSHQFSWIKDQDTRI